MSWSALTESDVLTRLCGPEVTAVKTAALGTSQGDPLPEIVQQVVDEVRGYVATGGVTLGPEGTIPSKLIGAALAMIRYRLATRLPVRSLLTEERKSENSDAVRLLERVADGKFRVEEPTTAATEQAGSPSPSFTDRTLSHTRTNQDGL